MSSGKIKANKLRQKLINLMYLIFIAIAFFQLPPDFVDTQKYVGRTLDVAIIRYETVLKNSKERFDLALEDSSIIQFKSSDQYLTGSEIIVLCDKGILSIDSSSELLVNSLGYNRYNFLNSSQSYRENNNIFLFKNKAQSLFNLFYTINSEYNKLIKNEPIEKTLPSNYQIVSSKGKQIEWKNFFFKKAPNSIVAVNLKKFKLDLLSYKINILNYLNEQLTKSKTERKISILNGDNLQVTIRQDNFFVGEKINFSMQSTVTGANIDSILKTYKIIVKNGANYIELARDKKGSYQFTPYDTGIHKLVVRGEDDTLTKAFTVNSLLKVQLESKYNNFYVGIDNPINLLGDFNKSKIVLKTSEGEVITTAKDIFLRFSTPGKKSISIYGMKQNDEGKIYLLKNELIDVKLLPDVKLVLQSGLTSGRVGAKLFKQEKSLKIDVELKEIEGFYSVKGFKVTKFTSEGTQVETNKGALFNNNVKKLIKSCERGDYFIFDDINVEGSDGVLKNTQSLYFKIK